MQSTLKNRYANKPLNRMESPLVIDLEESTPKKDKYELQEENHADDDQEHWVISDSRKHINLN